MESARPNQDLGKMLDVNRIQEIIPHRYPFLLVDRILEMSETRVVGLKNVTVNEPFFQGHFPGLPVMPGVLIVEAMAQTAGVYALSQSDKRGKIAYFATIRNVKFRKPVVPGDQLIMEIDFVKAKSKIVQVKGVAKVANEAVAEAEMMFIVIDPKEVAR